MQLFLCAACRICCRQNFREQKGRERIRHWYGCPRRHLLYHGHLHKPVRQTGEHARAASASKRIPHKVWIWEPRFFRKSAAPVFSHAQQGKSLRSAPNAIFTGGVVEGNGSVTPSVLPLRGNPPSPRGRLLAVKAKFTALPKASPWGSWHGASRD